MNHSSHQVCTVTNPGLEKDLNSSSFHILLAQGHRLLVLANDLVTRWLAWNLTCPLDKWKLKRYLPNKEIYFSQMTGQGFFFEPCNLLWVFPQWSAKQWWIPLRCFEFSSFPGQRFFLCLARFPDFLYQDQWRQGRGMGSLISFLPIFSLIFLPPP